ncbi:hypothetical protein [Pleurochrysis sp. endemic virus 1b]|nr:hypothetical protein [Pleurochrysis sp. endemic virus 1b]
MVAPRSTQNARPQFWRTSKSAAQPTKHKQNAIPQFPAHRKVGRTLFFMIIRSDTAVCTFCDGRHILRRSA